jgi:hypothetical protein
MYYSRQVVKSLSGLACFEAPHIQIKHEPSKISLASSLNRLSCLVANDKGNERGISDRLLLLEM